MSRWKLTRITFGNNEEFTLLDGEEVSVGRGINNNISLSSIVISRNHCVLNVQKDQVLITDLKSSNGVYVGLKKIPPNKPYGLQELDVIGIGWTKGAPVANIKDTEKYMFKLSKEKPPPIHSRIMYQSDNEFEDFTSEFVAKAAPATISPTKPKTPEKNGSVQSPILNRNPAVKRKLEETKNVIVKKEILLKNHIESEIINISDSDTEVPTIQETVNKKAKLDQIIELIEPEPVIKPEEIKVEKDDEYDPFKVKQEYLGYDDEPIQIDSDSDGESVQWRMRLSQSSPGKPFAKVTRQTKPAELEESCYSQIDDFEDDLVNDLIRIPPQPPDNTTESNSSKQDNKTKNTDIPLEEVMKMVCGEEEFLDDLISLDKGLQVVPQVNKEFDSVDDSYGKSSNELKTNATAAIEPQCDKVKQAQMIEPLAQMFRIKPSTSNESKPKSFSKHSKDKHKHNKHSSSKRQITDSQKEERKRKLKEIATKEKEDSDKSNKHSTSSSKDKVVVNPKLSNTNRGAFLTEVVQGVVKPMKRKESLHISSKNKDKDVRTSPKDDKKESEEDIENKRKELEKHNSSKHKKKEKVKKDHKSEHKEKDSSSKTKSSHSHNKKSMSSTKTENIDSRSSISRIETENIETDTKPKDRVPLKSLKPLSESEESYSGKPFSKVEPLPPSKPIKLKKKVRFSEEPPKVLVFEIEEGNNMKKTSLVKTSLVDIARQTPIFSLEKITLMKIFRWNPQWLEEQMNLTEPPPILGHHNPPMTMFHSFTNHNQYVQLVGDLLLMEIWECLTQGYNHIHGQSNGIQMRIASLPPIPAQDCSFELFNLSVNVSVPNNELKTVPRTGEVMLVAFGPENSGCKRFFYVHNVRTLSSPPNNIHTFYCISLHTCYTEKMKYLKPGELMIGLTLAYIQKELMLFDAMENLAASPLKDAILNPDPKHFIKCEPTNFAVTQWTKMLNPSQQMAVHSSVSAALGDRPCIEMVQGPPGTGKSSVICAMVMSYFYDVHERKQQNRGKILICATSNAAVDELVLRLLNIRQSLPKMERFRLVRVGRAEAMHPKAFDISSQQLAQRDVAARLTTEPTRPGLSEEISTLEAKINMWRTQELDAKDSSRAAYCRDRVKSFMNRIALLRAGGGFGGEIEMRAEQLAQAERRIIEGADIVVTTLASAHNHKMRVLRRRIALCIIDEAGQAIEPETLVPLTLDVTRLALIGDPQQLPGFICSQRAKKLGLGESLFYRLTSCAEQWPSGSPVILLNQQYRMQADIADYPNRAFYDGRIVSIPLPRPNLDIPPYSIVCIASGDKGQVSSGANEMEAWGVARLVVALQSVLKQHNVSLAVITPYNAHKEILKRNLKVLQDPADAQTNIEVNTVDSFQGQERDVVVVSLARSHGLGFLADTGRMNVMLTRARHALLVCLNPHAMLKNFQWRTLVEDAEKRKMYRFLPNKICQGTSAGPIPHAEVLKYVTYQKTSNK